MEQGDGHIVNTASLAGLRGVPGLGVYCTTKFAVVGLSESLVQELAVAGSGVGVSVLCPGFVQTRIGESTRNAPPSLAGWLGTEAETATRELGSALAAAGIPPTDVAEAVFDAVRTNRFWVIPHTRAALAATASRHRWMETGVLPEVGIEETLRP